MVEEFKSKKSVYKNLKKEVLNIIKKVINDQNDFIPHQIVGRVKKSESLERKISAKNNKYQSLLDITDLVAVRIITYLDSDVDEIAKIIAGAFDVDVANSHDKRNLKVNEFGYKSLHYILSLSPNRLLLHENHKYEGIRFEVQIRSILQHAWAEIEHDLGYKNEISVPEPFKRNFNRVAALLEVADIEFDRLKKDLTTYRDNLSTSIEKREIVDLNKDSLVEIANNHPILIRIKEIFTKDLGYYIIPADYEEFSNQLIRFNFLGYKTVDSITLILDSETKTILKFINNNIDNHRYLQKKSTFKDELVATFQLLRYLAARTKDIVVIEDFVNIGTQKYSSIPHQLVNEYWAAVNDS